MFGRQQNKSNKNSLVSQSSSSFQRSVTGQGSSGVMVATQPQDEAKMEEVVTEVVQEIFTHDRDEPIMKSGMASQNHKAVSFILMTFTCMIETSFDRFLLC